MLGLEDLLLHAEIIYGPDGALDVFGMFSSSAVLVRRRNGHGIEPAGGVDGNAEVCFQQILDGNVLPNGFFDGGAHEIKFHTSIRVGKLGIVIKLLGHVDVHAVHKHAGLRERDPEIRVLGIRKPDAPENFGVTHAAGRNEVLELWVLAFDFVGLFFDDRGVPVGDAAEVFLKGVVTFAGPLVQHRKRVEHVRREHIGELVRVLFFGVDQERRKGHVLYIGTFFPRGDAPSKLCKLSQSFGEISPPGSNLCCEKCIHTQYPGCLTSKIKL